MMSRQDHGAPDALDLLEARGHDRELLDRYDVRATVRDGRAIAAFPIVLGGRRIGWAKLDPDRPLTTLPEREHQAGPGAEPVPWNVDCLADRSLDGEPLIVTSSAIEALVASQAGFPRCIALPSPEPEPPPGRRFEAHWRWTARVAAAAGEIVLALAPSPSGAELLHLVADRVGRARCRWLDLCAHRAGSLSDLLARDRAPAVREVLSRAGWIAVPGLHRLSELPPRPDWPALDPGMGDLGRHLRLARGQLMVLGGIPGMGKSAFLDDLMGHMALNHGWRIAWFSPERPAQTLHRRELRRWHGRKPPSEMSEADIEAADTWIEERMSFLTLGDERDATLGDLLETAEASVLRHGTTALVLDPWNELEHSWPAGVTLTHYISDAVRRLRRFAERRACAVIVAVHPTKMRPTETGGHEVPGLCDLADSAAWKNKPDLGVILHRFAERTLIRIEKSRDHERLGTPGDLAATFSPATGRYEITSIGAVADPGTRPAARSAQGKLALARGQAA